MSERKCEATTKAGKPCKGPPLRGRTVCLAHADEETRGSVRFSGPQEGSGRPRHPRAVDVIRERIERDLDKWLKPLEDSLEAGRAVVVGTGPKARLEMVPDYVVRLRAVADALDRAYGRPAQSHEVEHTPGLDVDAGIETLLAEMARRDVDSG